MKRIWIWLLLHNSSGLACLIMIWLVGAAHILAGELGLLDAVNVPMVFRFSFIAGIAVFITMPLLEKLFKNY